MAEIYRKKALDQMNSPEQLDQMIPVAKPMTWLIIVGVTISLIAAFFWASNGSIKETVTYRGIGVRDGSSAVVCYVPLSISPKLHQGDPVHIMIETGRYAGTHGEGTVTMIEEHVATSEQMTNVLHGKEMVALFQDSAEPVIEIRCNTEIPFSEGSLMRVEIIVSDRTPLSYVLSR